MTRFLVAAIFAIAMAPVLAITVAGAQGAAGGRGADGADIVTVRTMRLVGNETRTRFVIDLDNPVEYGVLRLGDPYRLVIDLPRVTFAAPRAKTQGRGLVGDYRFGLIAPERARIVLDLTGPVDIAKAFALPAAGEQPARLVFDFVPASAEAFAAAASAGNPKASANGRTPK
ncbi:MAG: AMIN domain-containing protein, partial [Pseudomonadota bacterium]